jgi:hypothetical protein
MEDRDLIGYKVMRTENGQIISGADNRQSFKLELNHEISMPGNGIYIGVDRDYVMDYYSGLAEEEVLLTLRFNTDDIITGDLNDKEPELSVKKVTILNYEHILDGELLKPTIKTKKLKP